MNVKKITVLLAGVGLVASIVGCQKNYIDPTIASLNKADSTIQAYIRARGIKASQNSAGTYYTISTANPTGKTPIVGEEAAFYYNARTLAGALVDTTQKDTLVYIPLGAAGLNTNLQEIIRLMHVGETASLFLYNSQPLVNATNAVLLPAYTPYIGIVKLVASRSEDEQIDKYVADKNLTVTEKTASGLRFIKTVSNPTGTTLATGQSVTVKYSGILIHGTQPFDPGTTPLVFTLGQNQVVPGFEEGVRKLRVGEKATVIFPSSQGYGAAGVSQNNQYIILPYAPLIFDLEVLSAQ